MHHDTFNADFYVTVATIIPVLYLALTLQGQTLEDLGRRLRDILSGPSDVPAQRVLWQPLQFMFLCLAAYAIVAPIFFAEFPAIVALYKRSESAFISPGLILVNLLILLIAVVVGPFGKFMKTMLDAASAARAAREAEEADESHNDSQAPPE